MTQKSAMKSLLVLAPLQFFNPDQLPAQVTLFFQAPVTDISNNPIDHAAISATAVNRFVITRHHLGWQPTSSPI